MDKITYDEALGLLREAVEIRGEDYKYYDDFSSCQYFTEDTKEPMCIVGQAVALSDKYREELIELLYDYNETEFVPDEIEEIKEYFTEEALILFHTTQSFQDRGDPWGQAVESGTRG